MSKNSNDDVIEPFELQRDVATATDKFEGQGHDRTGYALARAIISLSNQDGAIGLEGEWGAGKSSVIDMASKKLSESSNPHKKSFCLFCFDLWAQHSDNLKRSFLVELLAWAKSEKLLTDKQYKERDEAIRDGSKTITYSVDREMSSVSFFILGLIPLFTVLLAWLGPVAFNKNVKAPFEPSDFDLLFFSLSPLQYTICGYLILLITAYFLLMFLPGGDENLSKKRRFYRRIAVFDKKSEDHVVKEDYREEDPASTEFQRHFRSILHAIQATSDNRVVIIFDNIDRLPKDEIIDVWREVRSIFAHAGEFSLKIRSGEDTAYAVTAVIPYDRAMIQEAAMPQKLAPEMQGGEFVLSQLNGTSKKNDGDELIRKTLNITLRVSPPLTTDWQAFFDDRLNETIQGLDDPQRLKLFRILDVHYLNLGKLPTPREIISFVNELAVLHSQWEADIPLESLAVYLVYKTEIESNTRNIVSLPVDKRILGEVDDPDLMKNLAAIAFNVDPERSFQVLLNPEIREAVFNRNFEAIAKLKEATGFRNALNEVVEVGLGQAGDDDPKNVASVASILAKLSKDGETYTNLWRLLSDAVLSLRDGYTDNVDEYEDFVEIISRASDAKQRSILAYLMKWFSKLYLNEDTDAEDMETYLSYVDNFLGHCGYDDPAKNSMFFVNITPIKVSATAVQSAALFSADLSNIHFEDIPIQKDAKDLSAFLGSRFWTHPNATGRLAQLDNGPISDATLLVGVSEIVKKLTEADQPVAKIKNPVNLLITLHKLRGLEQNEPLADAATNGLLVGYHGRALAEDDAETAANLLYLMAVFSELKAIAERSAVDIAPLGNTAAQQTELQELIQKGVKGEAYLDRLAGLFSKEEIATQAENAVSADPLILSRQVTRKAFMSDRHLLLHVESIFRHYDRLKVIFRDHDDFDVTARIADKAGSIPEHFEEWHWVELPLSLLVDGRENGSEGYLKAFKELDSWLTGLGQEDLEGLFTNEYHGIEHLSERVMHGDAKPAPSVLRDAISNSVAGYVISKNNLAPIRTMSEISEKLVGQAGQKAIANSFFVSLGKGAIVSDRLIEVVIEFPWLLKFVDLKKNPETFVNEILVRLIDANSDSTTGLIAEHSLRLAGLVKQDEGYSEPLNKSLEALEAQDEAAIERALKIRNALNIPKPKLAERETVEEGDEGEAEKD